MNQQCYKLTSPSVAASRHPLISTRIAGELQNDHYKTRSFCNPGYASDVDLLDPFYDICPQSNCRTIEAVLSDLFPDHHELKSGEDAL